MPRVKGGLLARKRHGRIRKRAKGYRGSRSSTIRGALNTIDTANKYATRDRRQKKREFRTLWNVRINAAVRSLGLSYSRFINLLKNARIELNRKMLSELAIQDSSGFQAVVKAVQK